MNGHGHPSSTDLLSTASGRGAADVLRHLERCPACRVRYSRTRRAGHLPPLEGDGLERVLSASQPLPQTPGTLVSDVSEQGAPAAGELWRIGRDEALVVWVRQVFEDGVADVVPVVLDVDLADEDSVLIPAETTTLGFSSAALVALRSHVDLGAFINRLSRSDIGDAVEEVVSAIREGRQAVGVAVGDPVTSDEDERIEYRQALRDLLMRVAPLAPMDPEDSSRDAVASEPAAELGVDGLVVDLEERLPGIRCIERRGSVVTVDALRRIESDLKVVYLGTAVICTIVAGSADNGHLDVRLLADACHRLLLSEPDVDAVAISLPVAERPTVLFSSAHMRTAIGVPRGEEMGPTATVEGYGLVDTLSKYFEEVSTNWEATEAAKRTSLRDISEIASARAQDVMARIRKEGEKARIEPKKRGFSGLPAALGGDVAEFLQAVVDRRADDGALARLIEGVDRD